MHYQFKTMKLNLIYLLLLSTCTISESKAQNEDMKEVSIRNMNVKWHYENNRIYFEMSAPTDGWVTIGLIMEHPWRVLIY